MKQIAENLWVLHFPLRVMGAAVGRNVSVMRLRTGQLIIHSTAPFSAADVALIRGLGSPAWLVEAALYHDTFAAAGAKAFPGISYLAPAGFSALSGVPTEPLEIAPQSWADEIGVLSLNGMPKAREHVFLHRHSRTLIVGDLLFNVSPDASLWTRLLLGMAGGIKTAPSLSRVFLGMIEDRAAFQASIQTLLSWDFDRIIVAHGDIVESGAKAKLAGELQAAGFAV